MKKDVLVFCLVGVILCGCAPKTEQKLVEGNEPASGIAAVSATEPEKEVAPANSESAKDLNIDAKTANDTGKYKGIECGEVFCQHGEKCLDNQCKTMFRMVINADDADDDDVENEEVYLAPIPKEGHVINENSDYWECRSETCSYQLNKEKTFTITKGLRIREDKVYCGGNGIELDEMEKFTCTDFGWICTDPKGCDCMTHIRPYNDETEVICSPGERCDDGCEFVENVLKETFLCKDGNCACGQNRCGKNQVCAYGDCYFAGTVRNGKADCEFSTTDLYLSSDRGCGDPEIIVRYSCKEQCPSEHPPVVREGYEYEYQSDWCSEISVGFWMCRSESGCVCGEMHCPAGFACADGQCIYPDFDESVGFSSRDDEYECGSEYKDHWRVPIFPKNAAHFQVYDIYMKNESIWACDGSGECICNGQPLMAHTKCVVEPDKNEYIICDGNGPLHDIMRDPQKMSHYRCDDGEFKCLDASCICGGENLPANAHCDDEIIKCKRLEKPDHFDGYECKDDAWICASGQCLCDGVELSKGAMCEHRDGHEYQVCGKQNLPGNTAIKYECVNQEWICPSGQCLCDGVELSKGAKCEQRDGREYLVCGDRYLTGKTVSEYQCVKENWESKVAEGKRHCNGKLLPVGTECFAKEEHFGKITPEAAWCGANNYLYEWDNYVCNDGNWVCTSKDKPCLCGGAPLPEGSICKNDQFECDWDSSFADDEDYACQGGRWIRTDSPEFVCC